VERLWESIKYEEVYVYAYEAVEAAHQGVERYLMFYNKTRPHQAHDGQTPDQVYDDHLTTQRTVAWSATRQTPLREGPTLSNRPELPLFYGSRDSEKRDKSASNREIPHVLSAVYWDGGGHEEFSSPQLASIKPRYGPYVQYQGERDGSGAQLEL
jgi:putative transposase